jgi:hypothetical protein
LQQSSTAATSPMCDYTQFSKLFVERDECLLLVRQVNQLIKAVQRHRGTSMGLLAGNSQFREEFELLQHGLERRLATLEAFAARNSFLSERDKENLSMAWKTIRSNWEEDQLKDNFELHSHFIEQLLVMVYGLAKPLEVPLIMPTAKVEGALIGNRAFSKERTLLQIEVLNFSTKALPEKIEQVAKIRGMATYAAASLSLDGVDGRKLRFLLSSSREQNDRIQQQAEKLQSQLGDALPGFYRIKQNELQLLQFLNTVESTIFMGKRDRDSAQTMFNMASDIIDVYWDVVSDGLGLIDQWHRDDLEAWVGLSS